jgi:hypothetical protein
MPRFLDTLGNNSLSIFVCDRCKMKRAYSDQRPDGNIPGIKVCSDSCSDQFDPYRLAPRPTERISLRFPRPDVDISVIPNAIVTETLGNSLISPESAVPPDEDNGNLDNLSP